MGNVIKSIVSEYHWSPNIIDDMFCDNFDYKGLGYWYDELIRINKMNKQAMSK